MVDPTMAAGERAIAFGPFHVLPRQRLLLEAGKPLRLGSRALDILVALTERPGELVSKSELMARLWPNTFVEEGNLKVHVAALRRALGDGQGGKRYIATSPGQGYRFVAPVTITEQEPEAPSVAATKREHNLPTLLTRLIGRSDTVSRLAEQLPRQRFLTIVGPGGIGKTSVALAVAGQLINAYAHGVWLVDLAPIASPGLVPTALAAAIGFEIRAENPLPGLIAFLEDKHVLLVFENCEHVAEATAGLVVAVLKGAAGVHILATSREPLRAEGEHLHRLSTLEGPPISTRLSAAEALAFPAVELFVERAAACLGEYKLTDADAPIVAEICRQLDGIPLAIEFAAARVDAFGIRGLAARLDDRLRLLTGGRRSASPRQQTMRATLDWSYGLLTEQEQKVLRCLAIFAGGFTLEAAGAVAADASQPRGAIMNEVAELVAKSLVVAEAGDPEPRLRLLETTRAYTLEKLDESSERDMLARRHAEYYRDFLALAAQDAAGEDWPAVYAPEIDNVRAALTWAFGPGGDMPIGVAIAADSVPIWLDLCLLSECHVWKEKAVANLDDSSLGTRHEMALQAALGISLRFTTGITEEAYLALTRALELAERFNDPDYQLRIYYVLWSYHVWRGDHRTALAFARRCESFAAGVTDPSAPPVADRMLGISQFYLGDLAGAQTLLSRAVASFRSEARRTDLVRFGLDQRLSGVNYQAVIFWLQGFPDQALQAARTCVREAQNLGHPVTLCNTLAWGAVVAVWAGDLEIAGRWADDLDDQAEKHSLQSYRPGALGAKGQLSAEQGDLAKAALLLHAALEGCHRSGYHNFYTIFANDLALAEAKAGRIDQGLAAIEEARHRAERSEELCYLPEVLRVRGELLLMQNRSNAGVAEDEFSRSLDLARRQGALSWELRTATSLARLWRTQDRLSDARNLLVAVYARFTEAFETADLRTTKGLLDELA